MNRTLRIGLVRRGFSRTGGAETYLRRFAKALVEAGHECVLFASDLWPTDEWSYGPIQRLPGSTPRVFADAMAQIRPRSQCGVLLSLERIWSSDFYRAADGVHRAWLKRSARYKTLAGRWTQRWTPKDRQILALEARLFTPDATRCVIAISAMVKEEITRYYGYPGDRIEVVYSGIPYADFQSPPELREQTRRRLGLGESDLAVLFAGSGWERKGLHYAVQAVEGVNGGKTCLLVAGAGDTTRYRSNRARFLGPVADMRPYYAAGDLFLLPSIYDPFSNACLEALASGLPVITTRSTGCSEIIAPGVDGEVLEDPEDVPAMTRAIEGWQDPEKRRHAKSGLHQLASKYDISENLRQILELVQRYG